MKYRSGVVPIMTTCGSFINDLSLSFGCENVFDDIQEINHKACSLVSSNSNLCRSYKNLGDSEDNLNKKEIGFKTSKKKPCLFVPML